MKPPDLPLFSGVEPVPKDEGSFDQWMFQVQGALDSHSEEAVRSAIVRSVRGEARELMRFIGFRAEISTILTGIEGRFGRGPSADKLQQEYYQLQQERGEKVQQFVSHLETKYWKLKEKFPDRYDHRQLKDHLFYGMHQHLRDSMWFLYKQEMTTYEDLLVATREAETEWTENKSVHLRSTTLSDNKGLKDLQKEIVALTATLKSATFQGAKPKKAGTTGEKQAVKGKSLVKTKENPKIKGPQTSSAGPFAITERPIQCFKCGGWGHGWRSCPSQGNINWRELSRASLPPKDEGPNKQEQ